MARVLRKKLAELDLGTFEKSCVRMMHGLHFRELKVARRSKDGPLMTARRREGSLEIRYAVRVLKGGGAVERKHVQELRRELQQTGANMGLLLCAGEARGGWWTAWRPGWASRPRRWRWRGCSSAAR